MNKKTLSRFNKIINKATTEIILIQSHKKDTSLDAVQFGAIIELLSLVLTRIDEAEKGIK